MFHRWLKIPYKLSVGVDLKHQEDELTVVLIHGLASSHGMWEHVIKRLESQRMRIISLDLLGFGTSPKPSWQTYEAKAHAASLRRTLRHLGVSGPVILVGHSMGALVAVKYTQRYPWAVDGLVLCSPPFYERKDTKDLGTGLKSIPAVLAEPDTLYVNLYKYSRGKPELAKKLAAFVRRANIMGEHFTVDDETLPAIVRSLEMSIENQQSLREAKQLEVPLYVLYGQFDPFIIKKRLRELAAANPFVDLILIPTAGHEVYRHRPFEKTVVDTVSDLRDTLVGPEQDS